MAIIPNTDVILLKCPLELNQQHQINFANANAQYNYFYNLPKNYIGDDFTYQRKDNLIRVDMIADDLYQYNYVMYRNESYSGKWFYAFIDKIEYVNDNCTYIYISTDTFQTWQFDLTYKQTFVEREHVNDDRIGKHTILENLEIGEYEIVDQRNIPMYEDSDPSEDWVPCFCVTALPEGCVGAVDGRVKGDNGLIGGVFNSLKFFACHTIGQARKMIEAYEQGSVTTDAIVNIYMVPRVCVNEIDSPTTCNAYALYPLYNYAYSDDYKLQQPYALAENYVPRNNKLYCYPYSYIYMSNNVGEDVEFRWEDFPKESIGGSYNMPTITYYKYYVPSASISAKLILRSYKNYTSDSSYATQMANYGINYGKVPVCAWTTDYYTNWLTQNGVNVGVNIASSLATMGLGIGSAIATGGASAMAGAGSVVGGLSSIGSTLAEMHKAQTIPPQAHGNTNTGDMLYSLKRNSISCYFMSIRPEMASVIDSFFDMFGYKVNQVKVPNITGRYNWNYVKTIDCYIEADIPQEDLQEIKNMFNSGITIWHHPETFMNYSQSNPIM